jgi:hypothetical protein
MKTNTFLLATTLSLTAFAGNIFAQAPISLDVNTLNPSCHGSANGAIVVNILGGVSPYRVNGVAITGSTYVTTDLTAGNYTLIVADATSESSTADVTLIQPQPINVHATVNHVTTYNGADGSIDIETNVPSTYFWTSVNGSSVYETSEDQPELKSDRYEVLITETATGCSTTRRFEIRQPAAPSLTSNYTPRKIDGMSSNSDNKSVTVYPNPSAGSINIKADGETVEAYIINEMGSIVHRVNLDLEIGIDTVELERGVYTLFYTEIDGSTYGERIIIK